MLETRPLMDFLESEIKRITKIDTKGDKLNELKRLKLISRYRKLIHEIKTFS